jgi:uncharacterized membrane protein
MSKALEALPRPWWKLRPSLTIGLLVGIATYLLIPLVDDATRRVRFTIGWDLGASCALAIMYAYLRKSSALEMKRIAEEQDVSKWFALILSLAGAAASLVLITWEMPLVKQASGLEQALRIVWVIFTVVLSWSFIQTVFALHYAHDFYMAVDVHDGAPHPDSLPLLFPNERTPTYGDFLYFSFTIGMTFQVSDVQIADASMRRLVLAHGVLAFFYSTGIVALAINLVAGLI